MDKSQEELAEEAFREKKKQLSIDIATTSAWSYALGGGIVSLAGTLLATKYNTSFRNYMSISAKTSIPVMTSLFLFGLQFELKLHDVIKHPRRYGIDDKNHVVEIKKESKLPIQYRLMNYFHDNPFHLIWGIGLPFVAYIFNEQSKLKHLTLSQRVMHSRVIGQAGILCVALTTMTFKDYMDKRGKFLEPEFN